MDCSLPCRSAEVMMTAMMVAGAGDSLIDLLMLLTFVDTKSLPEYPMTALMVVMITGADASPRH